MAEQPPIPENVTPAQFFEQFLPMGFAAQAQESGTSPPDFKLQFHVTGEGGGDWLMEVSGGKMSANQGSGEAHFTVTLSLDDWRDAVLGRNGAALSLILPRREGRPSNSARALTLKGTLALELAREGNPFQVEMCFNNAAAPRTKMRMTLSDYLDMQSGKLNGQQAFMSGKLRVEGDMGLLMQIAALAA